MAPVVCVVFGGKSSEYEVSCKSAYNIISCLENSEYKLLLVGITKDGNTYLYSGNIENIKDGSWVSEEKTPCVISPNPSHGGLLVEKEDGSYFVEKVDVYFPVLHGKNGEDGTIQGVFELSQVAYVGNGVVGSALCMDKIMTKKILESAGIPVTEGFEIIHGAKDAEKFAHEKIEETIGYPVVVKPSNAGSSVGISLVENKEELSLALKIAAKEDRRVLIEKMLNIREVECAVMGSHEKAEASCLGEIVKTTKMYDYETKYIDDTTTLVIPAELDGETAEKIRNYAVNAFYALDCTGLARVDFFVEKDTGEIFLNEINTLPGFTDISMYPMLWKASGIDKKELLDKLICLAKDEFGRR
ncbi:MAG: D-alanine--D-alanine ligase [Clostridia bacterium]|nr:D-alanine--D-alanine ligase [Clostridia bacterium]